MRIVIQCADRKVAGAGCFRASDGALVSFVARPDEARESSPSGTYARPDDPADGDGRSWRDLLVDYNAFGANPFHLESAGRLYRHHAYSDLVARFGLERVYILSAGWGLVRGSFLLPRYDITFSASAERYKRRRQHDRWPDFSHLEDTGEPIVFFGGKDYLPLFCILTSGFKSPRTAYYSSGSPPIAPGCNVVKYLPTCTNWHYGCVASFLAQQKG